MTSTKQLLIASNTGLGVGEMKTAMHDRKGWSSVKQRTDKDQPSKVREENPPVKQ